MSDREQIVGDLKQRAQLAQLVARARRLREVLGPLLETHAGKVHFRPGTTGVDMVGLLPERPLQGRAAIRNLPRFAEHFADEFRRWCVDAAPSRATAETRLQAYLIAGAYRSARRLEPINHAFRRTGTGDELLFATDDIPVPFKGKRFACDVLAVSSGSPRRAAVIELSRGLDSTAALVRVEAYAQIVERHADLYGELFSALLDDTIRLAEKAERFVLWPRELSAPSRHELEKRGVHIAFWSASGDHFVVEAK